MTWRWMLLATALGLSAPVAAEELVETYLERYFEMFPSAATAAGRHDRDTELEDLSPERRRDWLEYNRRVDEESKRRLDRPDLPLAERLDLELLQREAQRQVFRGEVLRSAERDPLFWTSILGDATVFLLVRDDLPRAERLASAAARSALIPRLTAQARAALETEPERISAEICRLAERQARATATFYRDGLPRAGEGIDPDLQDRLFAAGAEAGAAAEALADLLRQLTARAQGSPRLGALYAENFRLVTGVERPVDEVLAQAQRALVEKVEETAATSRSYWSEYFSGQTPPADDRAVIAAMFERVSRDRARTTEEFIADYRRLVDESVRFVRQRQLMTLPEPLTLHLDRSPSFFIGQSVGGVYPAGPYAAADAKTLLFLPTPPDDLSAEQRDAFFRDFNHHFNVMITPHELIPGHYLQLKFAARHPRKIRAMFGDGVYIEGWGTFAERLMLDLGWGGPLDRVAHLKKQLENIARTIVDIRVHTQGMTRQEVVDFVQNDALQDEQFAANMWRRAITSSPQLTFYFLGYSEVWGLFEDVKSAQGDDFQLRRFMDGMMELGPVPVRHYRDLLLPRTGESGAAAAGG